ncbi:cytochrome P450 [Cyathus striatus]|nr:cytochrome P450 [Cyathus striatus]
MPFDIRIIDVTASIVGVVTVYLYLRSRGRHIPLPPGPRKLPLIGNVLDIPSDFPSKGYDDMCKKYNSDIIHLNAFGTDIVVVNTYETAQELLEKRSAIYSSRPRAIMFNELAGYDFLLVAMPDNTMWKTHRRLFSKYFRPQHTEINQPREIEHVHVLLRKLLESPEKFYSHIRHTVGAISLSEVYGLDIKSDDDPYINLSEEVLKLIARMTIPGAFLVETFPLLRYIPEWFPGAHFQKFAKKARKMCKQVLNVPYNASLAAMNDGTILPSFISEGSVDTQNSRNVDQSQHIENLKAIGAMSFLGAMDTTDAALGIFILVMMLYPDVQKTAQQELDEVLGDRLPDHSDIPSIPYITALLLEVLRWETPVQTGFGHKSTADDVFRGYFIPKGSIVIPLQREMLHEERDYPDPHMFKPERFLKDGKINDAVKNPEDIAFGFGRRKCPGRHLAKSSLWLAMASILSTFDIEKPVDKEGNVVEPMYKFSNNGVNHLEPFTCFIKPRSEKAVSLVKSVS